MLSISPCMWSFFDKTLSLYFLLGLLLKKSGWRPKKKKKKKNEFENGGGGGHNLGTPIYWQTSDRLVQKFDIFIVYLGMVTTGRLHVSVWHY